MHKRDKFSEAFAPSICFQAKAKSDTAYEVMNFSERICSPESSSHMEVTGIQAAVARLQICPFSSVSEPPGRGSSLFSRAGVVWWGKQKGRDQCLPKSRPLSKAELPVLAGAEDVVSPEERHACLEKACSSVVSLTWLIYLLL